METDRHPLIDGILQVSKVGKELYSKFDNRQRDCWLSNFLAFAPNLSQILTSKIACSDSGEKDLPYYSGPACRQAEGRSTKAPIWLCSDRQSGQLQTTIAVTKRLATGHLPKRQLRPAQSAQSTDTTVRQTRLLA